MNENMKHKPFWQWGNGLDQLTFVLLAFGGIVAVGVGMENLTVVMMSSGLSVFLEDEMKARIIAVVMPLSALGIKAVTSQLDYARHRQYYTMTIAALMGTVLVAWVILFAQEFQSGMSTGLPDWETLMNTSGSSVWLVGCQLALEVLAGATLWLMAEGIWSKYSPDVKVENPEYAARLKAIEADRARLSIVSALLSDKTGELYQLHNEREGSIRDRVAKFVGYVRQLGMAILLGICLSFTSLDIEAKTYVVGLSSASEQSEKTEQAQRVMKWLSELSLGDQAFLFDAYSTELVGEFKVPDKASYVHPRAKLMANRSAIANLMQFSQQPSVARNDAINLPGILRAVRGVRRSSGEDVELIIIGSPVFHDQSLPEFSMQGGRYPSDGHLNVTRAISPFGTKGDEGMLDNVRIHWVTRNGPEDSRIQFAVQRFYALYIAQLGGKLVSYDHQIELVMANATKDLAAQSHSYVLGEETKVEMVRLLPERVAQQNIYEQSVTTTPLDRTTLEKADRVILGLRWSCACDLDIYAQAFPGANTLFYGNPESPEGVFYKDHRSANAAKGWETIAYSLPIDLRTMRIGINFFEGNAPEGVTGEVRLSVNGNVYAKSFSLTGSEGNRGADITVNRIEKDNSKYTISMSATDIVGA